MRLPASQPSGPSGSKVHAPPHGSAFDEPVRCAVTTSPAVALVVFLVFGAHAFIWGTTSRTVRQRAVPMAFQGRVSSVYMLGLMGGMVVGQALAGPIARLGGITAPFWFAGIGSALMLVAVWRQLMHIAHAEAEEA